MVYCVLIIGVYCSCGMDYRQVFGVGCRCNLSGLRDGISCTGAGVGFIDVALIAID